MRILFPIYIERFRYHLRLRFTWVTFLALIALMGLTLPRLHAANTEPSPPPQSVIKIPWGFEWGESPQRLEEALIKVKAKVIERKQMGERGVTIVEGFVQPLLQRALFYFQRGGLNEIELQYGNKNWDSIQYGDFFDQTRRNIENRYGQGRIIARQKTRDGEVLETLIGYQWTQVSATLQLFFFTAERSVESFRLVSLHYRGS